MDLYSAYRLKNLYNAAVMNKAIYRNDFRLFKYK